MCLIFCSLDIICLREYFLYLSSLVFNYYSGASSSSFPCSYRAYSSCFADVPQYLAALFISLGFSLRSSCWHRFKLTDSFLGYDQSNKTPKGIFFFISVRAFLISVIPFDSFEFPSLCIYYPPGSCMCLFFLTRVTSILISCFKFRDNLVVCHHCFCSVSSKCIVF